MSKPLTHIIFVYGTLKRSCHNYWFLKDFRARFLSTAEIGKEYTLFVGFLPFLVEKVGDGAKGELFLVDDVALQALDRLEGHPHNYKRSPVKVTTPDGKIVEAWAYIFQRELPIGCERTTDYQNRR